MSAVTAALVMGGAGLASGLMGMSAARGAARQQARAAREALALQRQMFAQQQAAMEPFRQSGVLAQNRLMNLLGLSADKQAEGYGSLARDFGQADFQADPGYAFRMSEGLKALERSAAGRGGAASGAAMKGITDYGQNLASQEYQNAYNRFQQNRQARLAPLQNIMGVGMGAAQGLSGAAGQFGQAGGQSLMDIGNAQASGRVGAANALAGGLGTAINAYQFNQMMNNMRPQSPGFYGPSSIYSNPGEFQQGVTSMSGPMGGYMGDVNAMNDMYSV